MKTDPFLSSYPPGHSLPIRVVNELFFLGGGLSLETVKWPISQDTQPASLSSSHFHSSSCAGLPRFTVFIRFLVRAELVDDQRTAPDIGTVEVIRRFVA